MISRLRHHPDAVQLALLLALTFSTGVIDAVGYLSLDRVFAGNMTGNVIILGMAFSGTAGLPVVGPLVALAAFTIGALAAGRLLRHRTPGWSRPTLVAIASVGGIILVSAVGFALTPTTPSLTLTVTAALGIAMGVQAGSARQIGERDLTTVVVTSALVGLAFDAPPGGEPRLVWVRRVGAVALIGLGALCGALLTSVHVGLALTLAAVVTFLVVLVGAIARPQPAQG